MSDPDYMRQCLLARIDERGMATTVTWLPECYAKHNIHLSLKRDEDQQWTRGWRVVEVYPTRLAAREVHERSRDHIKQRKASDI